MIPQAWQRFAQSHGALWDKRTVELCPNCHRGVHERIVAYMRRGAPFGRDRLARVAEEAVTRYEAYGGSLAALRAAGLYGQQ